MAAKGNSAPTYKSGSGAEIAVAQWPIEKVKPYEKNPRAINDKAIGKVAASIKEFGFQQPIVVDRDGVIIVGHTRRKAAELLGLSHVPVVVADLPEAKARAYRLADNRTAQETSWLDDILGDELAALKGLDFDLSLTGFDERELDKLLLDDAELARAEETQPVPENPVTVKGDVWLLGKHRIVCGDSTVATDVDKALNGVKPHLMVTDPPYGVNYDPKWRAEAGVNKNKAKMGEVLNDDKADWREAWALFPGEACYVWHAGLMAGDAVSDVDVWSMDVDQDQHYVADGIVTHNCWYGVRKGGGWVGDRSQSTLWSIKSRDDSGMGHGTQKPVECMRRPILNNSSPGHAIYEPFSGSGTTIIAGEMTGRSVHAIELNPAYVDVAVMRWQEFAGGKGTLEGDGRTFDEIKAERHGGQDKAKARSKAEA